MGERRMKILADFEQSVSRAIRYHLPSCIGCLWFQEANEMCQRYQARPPARTIANGCEGWESDIPF